MGTSGSLRYRIRSGNDDSTFVLGLNTGALSVNSTGRGLNFEGTQTRWTLVIEARDPALDEAFARVSVVSVTIRVTDVNDVSPVFVGLPYQINSLPGG